MFILGQHATGRAHYCLLRDLGKQPEHATRVQEGCWLVGRTWAISIREVHASPYVSLLPLQQLGTLSSKYQEKLLGK